MKYFSALIICLCWSCVSCSPKMSVAGCSKYDAMILGDWVNKLSDGLVVRILPDRIAYGYDGKWQKVCRIDIVDGLKNCDEEIANYPPSQLRILEYCDGEDTLVNHIISIDAENMEWASGNHDVHWRKATRIQVQKATGGEVVPE